MSRATKQAPVATSQVRPKVAEHQPSWKDKIHHEDLELLKNTFDLFDEDHSGTIDPAEIGKILEELGPMKRDPFIFSIIESLKDKGKPVTFDDFLEHVCPKIGDTKSKAGLKTIFNHMDKGEDGVIDFEELKQLSRLTGDTINDDDLLEMLHNIFVNNKTSSNESITFDEFYLIVTKFYKK